MTALPATTTSVASGTSIASGSSGPAADVAAGLGTILGVWAHPDDETYLSGGLMAAAAEAGARVVCITATRGERGTPDPEAWPPARLAALRADELGASLRVLGVSDHRQLDYEDGRCALVAPGDAIDRIAAVIAEVRPDTVLTFGPDGITGHPDHISVSGWATAAVRRSEPQPAPRLLYAAKTEAWCNRFDPLHRTLQAFPSGPPPFAPLDEVVVDVTLGGELLDRKIAALMAQTSQVTPLVEAMGEEAFRSWVANECFRQNAS